MKKQKGHALIEMAISLTVMVTLISATFQLGYVFYTYNQMVTAVGSGARYAATSSPDQNKDERDRSIRNVIVYGNAEVPANAKPLISQLTPDLVDIRWIKNESGAISAVNISIREFTVDAFFRVFKFTGRPGVVFPYVGTQPAASLPAAASK